MEQLITKDNKLKNWKTICEENNRSMKGPKPGWMKKIELITTHNNINRKLVGVYKDLGVIINRREENNIIKDKWEEIEENFDIEELNNLKEINERNIQIDNIMEGEELEKLKDKMKQEFLINYYNNSELKFLIIDNRESITIQIRREEEIEMMKLKINRQL
ncbi:hypothetical protein C1645_818960 [Glomus cerebriforme]|uniref:Uncharacterized protein n=1 Tax=Glomus cerebriforme TaxID=658196 RepID=A0A397T7F3_9GLOM|nr:hypothetical protein C1645_818960 [Glomus cerebriforme]